MKWNNFIHQGQIFDLSHLHGLQFNHTRLATENSEEKKLSVYLSFSDHCFTDHFGQDDSWIYLHARSKEDRYFCRTRYELSKHLPNLIKSILNTNPYVLMTFVRHREQFFYLENEYHGETYRVFFEVSAPKADYTDIRIDIKSAYDVKEWSNAVSGSAHYKLWRIIDARLAGVQLNKKRKR